MISRYKSFWILFLFAQMTQLYSQEFERVNIAGTIIVNSTDLEGVTVYNSVTNTGTVTDAKGQFVITAALNDKLNISALQFQNFEIIINQDIMDSQTLIAVLVEEVNKLPDKPKINTIYYLTQTGSVGHWIYCSSNNTISALSTYAPDHPL